MITSTMTEHERVRETLWQLDNAIAARTRARTHGKELARVMDWSLHCRVEANPLTVLCAAREVGAYNAFNPRAFARLLRAIDRAIPRMRYPDLMGSQGLYPNPNNGTINYRLSLGNEGSLVLYVEPGRFGGIEVSADELLTMCDVIMRAAREAGADEADLTTDEGVITGVRLWWD